MRYRPEIDGLRTIAVGAVIIYHAELVIGDEIVLKGGFIGVDVFFVISGYLITSLILGEYRDTQNFSVVGFYERRARRLLPALLCVALASMPFAWIYLIPQQLTEYAESLIASIFFVSNFYWNSSLQEYGAEPALLIPFLHTWSLAVEEQFYILYPWMLLALIRLGRRRAILCLATIMIASLVFAEIATRIDPAFSFYLLPSRFWELLAGGLLAYHRLDGPGDVEPTLTHRLMPLIGLLLILLSAAAVRLDSHHPGLATLFPVIGTVLVIRYASKNDPVTRLLSSKPFVGLGLISYSLYLWHYPIFAFARLTSDTPSNLDKAGWIGLTLLLSVVTYLAVERPFRNRARIRRPALIASLFASFALLLAVGLPTISMGGFPSRMPEIISRIETNVLRVRICSEDPLTCSFNTASDRRIFIVGDSHMMTLEKPLLRYASDNHFRLTTLNGTGCQYIPNLVRVTKTGQQRDEICVIEYQRKRREILLSAPPSIVIVGGRLPLILSESRFDNREGGYEGEMQYYLQDADNSLDTHASRKAAIFREYRNALLELARHGHTVVIVYPIPEVGWHVPRRIRLMFTRNPQSVEDVLSANPITTSYEVYRERNRESFALLDGIHHDNILRVYPHQLFCNTVIAGRCVTHDLDNSYYRDDDHLSDVGSEMLLGEIERKLIAAGRLPRPDNT